MIAFKESEGSNLLDEINIFFYKLIVGQLREINSDKTWQKVKFGFESKFGPIGYRQLVLFN